MPRDFAYVNTWQDATALHCAVVQLDTAEAPALNRLTYLTDADVACMQAYSDANPAHEPIAIYVEFKTDDLSAYVGPLGSQLAPVLLNATSTPGPDT